MSNGPNLITQSTADIGTSNWSVTNATLTAVNGTWFRMDPTNTGSSHAVRNSQVIPVTPGQVYSFEFDLVTANRVTSDSWTRAEFNFDTADFLKVAFDGGRENNGHYRANFIAPAGVASVQVSLEFANNTNQDHYDFTNVYLGTYDGGDNRMWYPDATFAGEDNSSTGTDYYYWDSSPNGGVTTIYNDDYAWWHHNPRNNNDPLRSNHGFPGVVGEVINAGVYVRRAPGFPVQAASVRVGVLDNGAYVYGSQVTLPSDYSAIRVSLNDHSVANTSLNFLVQVLDDSGQMFSDPPPVLVSGMYIGSADDFGGEAPPPPAPVIPEPTGLFVTLEVQEPPLPSDNRISNPHGEVDAFGWVSETPNSTITSVGEPGWTFLRFQAGASGATTYTSELFDVDDSLLMGMRMLSGAHTNGTKIGVVLEWFDGAKAYLSETAEEIFDPATDTDGVYERLIGVATGAGFGRIRFNQYQGTGPAFINDYFDLREVTIIQGETSGDVSNIAAWQADTFAKWTDVIEPAHEIVIERDSVDVGLLGATVLDETYDPANGGLIRPGAGVRVRVFHDGGYTGIFKGVINNVQAEYPRDKTARVSLTASDAMNFLSNQDESRGVATIDELPYLLEGKGVKWSANGSGNQVGAAAQVSSNDSASLFDQMVITRDSDKGYLWVDRNNTVQMWNRSLMPTAPVVEFSDVAASPASYSSIDLSFDTTNCINVVEVTYLRYDGVTGDTEEIKYGPYTDPDSVKTWGAYKSTFTVHGIPETEANMQAFANEVLAKNATPAIKPNRILVPIRNESERAQAAAVDLYSMVGVKYSTKYDGDLRVVSIRHEITPDKWLAEYTFEKGDSVAIPVWTPSVNGA